MPKKPGPKNTPEALKELAGNPGKRPLNTKEPKFPKGMPTAPSYVVANDYAYALWKSDGAMLLKAGVLTRADREMFALYCMTASLLKEVEEELATLPRKDEGNSKKVFPFFSTPNNYLQEHPLIATRVKVAKLLDEASSAFGLTPSARSRMQIHAAGPGPKTKAEKEEIDLLGPVE
ncbi:MAG: P27 family phage terminase small subunit [Candidatus Melainabacteria bacterium]|nr:MAG: P27 family phage terminase small subunit [Candidatus Melainabacteria bacterium]